MMAEKPTIDEPCSRVHLSVTDQIMVCVFQHNNQYETKYTDYIKNIIEVFTLIKLPFKFS